MTTWILLGGPHHTKTGADGDEIPANYAFEGLGNTYSPVYPDGTREAGHVYRWAADTAYLRDGKQIVENYRQGVYGTTAENAGIAALGVGMASEGLEYGLSNISVEPDSEGADRARAVIDAYRERGLI